MSLPSDTGRPRLDSWKAIADYLGRDVRTVMRWAKSHGLPVRRLGTARRRPVFAYVDEVDRWMAAGRGSESGPGADPQPTVSTPQTQGAFRARSRIVGGLITVLGLAILLAIGLDATLRWRPHPKILRAAIFGRELASFDSGNRELWRYALPETAAGDPVKSVIRVADVDNDGQPDVLLGVTVQTPRGEGTGLLMLLDSSGRLRWQRSLNARFAFGATEYGPSWYPDDAVVYSVGSARRIAVAQHHHTWWPDVVTTYDGDGRLVAQFVNAGWINRLNVTADGRYLLAAGVNNGLSGPVLAVLNAANPTGASPAEGGTLPACTNCPSGVPERYFVAPWSDLAVPPEMSFAGVVQIMPDGLIEWRIRQGPSEGAKAPEVIVNLSPNGDVVQRTVNDDFVELHASFERAERLASVGADCRHPLVREWRPGRGWHDVK